MNFHGLFTNIPEYVRGITTLLVNLLIFTSRHKEKVTYISYTLYILDIFKSSQSVQDVQSVSLSLAYPMLIPSRWYRSGNGIV